MDVVRQRSPVVGNLVECGPFSSNPISHAQGASMVSRNAIAIVDTYGFIRWLGELAIASIRGALVVIVLDTWDIRPLCKSMNLPCLEPWNDESLSLAVKEALEYSPVVGRPYVVRLNPLLSKNLCSILGSVETKVEGVSFNKNWGLGHRWWLPERFNMQGDWFRYALERARLFAKDGEVLREGYLMVEKPGDAESLYINPLPVDVLKGVKLIEESGNYLFNEFKLANLEVSKNDAYETRIAILRRVWAIVDKSPIDPGSLVKFCIFKLMNSGEFGPVPIVVASPYIHRPTRAEHKPDYTPTPVYFRPIDVNDLVDVVHVDPQDVFHGIGEYPYGPRILLASSCDPDVGNVKGPAIVLVQDPCPPLQGQLTYEVLGGAGIDKLCRIVRHVIENSEVAWVRVRYVEGYVAVVDRGLCDICGDCMALGCNAIEVDEKGYPSINANVCIGCGICVSSCSRGAISLVKRAQGPS